jgi:pimeloyl-ACP methyl ester carboxylesterase
MTPQSLLQLKKSTTGRLARRAVRLLDGVVPRVAQRLAFDWFGTPRRRTEPPFIVGHRFSLPRESGALAVWDWGEGRTVLLVHGWNGNGAQLSGFVAPLVRAGYYAAAPDLPGHGHSGGTRTHVRDMADALLQIGKRIGPVHAVIAHSFGAAATLIALSEGLGAERAVLIAPPVDLPRYATAFGDIIGLSPRSTMGLLARIEAAVGGRDALDLLRLAGRQKARTLVLCDPDDREVPFEEARSLADAWPGASLAAVTGAGHSRALRDAEVISRAVSFVADPIDPVALTG